MKDLTPAPSEVFLCKECHPLPWWIDLRWMTDILWTSSYTFIQRLFWKILQSSGLKAGDSSRTRPVALILLKISLHLQRGFCWSQIEVETLEEHFILFGHLCESSAAAMLWATKANSLLRCTLTIHTPEHHFYLSLSLTRTLCRGMYQNSKQCSQTFHPSGLRANAP